MENLPERQPSKSPSAHVRASDADRDLVIDTLRSALASGQLSPEEHSDRLDAVYQAKTLGELEPITYDLQHPEARPVSAPGSAVGAHVDTSHANEQSEKMVGIFGGGTKRGRWRIRRRTKAVMVFGGFDLDCTEAILEAPVVEIKVFALFGGLSMKIPENVEVRNEVAGILGGSDVGNRGTPPPGAPVIILKGVAIFGGVSVSS